MAEKKSLGCYVPVSTPHPQVKCTIMPKEEQNICVTIALAGKRGKFILYLKYMFGKKVVCGTHIPCISFSPWGSACLSRWRIEETISRSPRIQPHRPGIQVSRLQRCSLSLRLISGLSSCSKRNRTGSAPRGLHKIAKAKIKTWKQTEAFRSYITSSLCCFSRERIRT